MPREVPCDLFAQIESWTHAVNQQADRSVQPPPPSPRNLRPRPLPRPKPSTKQSRYLAPTSANPRLRKAPLDEECVSHTVGRERPRKRARKMPGNTGNEGDPEKEDIGARPRGRPPGSKNKIQPVLTSPESLAPSSLSKSSSKPKSGSPKRGKSRANVKLDASIELAYLKSCRPSVRLMTPAEALETGPIPPKIQSLYQKLDDVPLGCIPAELKVRLLILC